MKMKPIRTEIDWNGNTEDFASLCEKYPKVIIPKLIPILNGLVSESLSQGEENTLANCFDLVIPVYFKHTEADNLSRIELYRSFINNVCALSKETRPRFYKAFVHSLSMIPRNSGSELSPIGSFKLIISFLPARFNHAWNFPFQA